MLNRTPMAIECPGGDLCASGIHEHAVLHHIQILNSTVLLRSVQDNIADPTCLLLVPCPIWIPRLRVLAPAYIMGGCLLVVACCRRQGKMAVWILDACWVNLGQSKSASFQTHVLNITVLLRRYRATAKDLQGFQYASLGLAGQWHSPDGVACRCLATGTRLEYMVQASEWYMVKRAVPL